MIELFSVLIEEYESREHPVPTVSPAEMLSHLLEVRKLKHVELTRQTGIPAATLSNILSGRRGVSKQNALKLAQFFCVSPVVFLSPIGPSDRMSRQDEEALTSP